MQPRIVEQEAAFEALPKFESAAVRWRHDHLRVRLSHERNFRIARRQMPFAQKARVVAALAQVVRDRPARRLSAGHRDRTRHIPRQRIEITPQAVRRRRHPREQRGPRKRPERMRCHRLGVVDALRRQRVEVGRSRIRVAGVSASLRPPLRGDDPQNIRSRLHADISIPGERHRRGGRRHGVRRTPRAAGP